MLAGMGGFEHTTGNLPKPCIETQFFLAAVMCCSTGKFFCITKRSSDASLHKNVMLAMAVLFKTKISLLSEIKNLHCKLPIFATYEFIVRS